MLLLGDRNTYISLLVNYKHNVKECCSASLLKDLARIVTQQNTNIGGIFLERNAMRYFISKILTLPSMFNWLIFLVC